MALNPSTKAVEPDPVRLPGKTIWITDYHSGFVAYLPDIPCGLCGDDLRSLSAALLEAAKQVDKLNRAYEKGKQVRLGNSDEYIRIE